MPVLTAPALPLHTAGKYVAAAYIVFFALVLIYVAIMAVRLNRIEREVGELLERTPVPPPPHPELAGAVEQEVAVPDAAMSVAREEAIEDASASKARMREESARV